MLRHLFLLSLASIIACSDGQEKDIQGGPPAIDMSTDTAADMDTIDDTGAVSDTGSPLPDWVDPDVPEGPIPEPEGTNTEPEEGDFSWDGVGEVLIDDSLPRAGMTWSEYPRAGDAQILAWSDSEACVCFDADCTTCSEVDCSPETCSYDLNDSHTLNKYNIELRSTAYTAHALTFEVNVSADPPLVLTIDDVLARLERIPVEYWYGLQIITEFGHGIQFLHTSYFAPGAAAYGSMNYIDTRTVDISVLLHELGHTFEQYTRIGNAPVLEPQSNILNPIWRNAIRSDDVRTSRYGNSNEWEDMAEFSRIHAQCLAEGTTDELEALSPERFRIWERILLNGTTIHP